MGGFKSQGIFSPPPFWSNGWYPSITGQNSTALVEGNAYYTPLVVPSTSSFKALGCYTITAAVGTSPVLRMGLYTDSGSQSPQSLLFEAGTIDLTLTTAQTLSYSFTLSPGLYWIAGVQQGGTTSGAVCRTDTSQYLYNFVPNSVGPGDGTILNGQVGSVSIAGALPATTTGTFTWSGRAIWQAQAL